MWIAILNVNGAKQAKRQTFISEFVTKQNIDVACLQEVDSKKFKAPTGYQYVYGGLEPDVGFLLKESIQCDQGSMRFEDDGSICSLCCRSLAIVNVPLPSGTGNFTQRESAIRE